MGVISSNNNSISVEFRLSEKLSVEKKHFCRPSKGDRTRASVQEEIESSVSTNFRLFVCPPQSICRRLFGVVCRGAWSGNAILIGKNTFIAPRHVVNCIYPKIVRPYMVKQSHIQSSLHSWKSHFKSDVLLVESHNFCYAKQPAQKGKGIFRVVSVARSSTVEVDAVILYAQQINLEAEVGFSREFPQSEPAESSCSSFRPSFRQSNSEEMTMKMCSDEICPGDAVITLWIRPIPHLGDFDDPTGISDLSELLTSRNCMAYTISYVESYVRYPFIVIQTSKHEHGRRLSIAKLQEEVKKRNLLGSNSEFVESTSLGSSGGLVFRVSIHKHQLKDQMDISLNPIGFHIGKNDVKAKAPEGASAREIVYNFDETRPLGEFVLFDQAMKNIQHPIEVLS